MSARPTAAQLAARRRVIAESGARVVFASSPRLVPRSQCGGAYPERHPGDFGFSHCWNHKTAAARALARAAAGRGRGMAERGCGRTGDGSEKQGRGRMHAAYLKLIVANCRQRIADGDHPTVNGHGSETLEEAVVALADALSASPAAALAEALRELLNAYDLPASESELTGDSGLTAFCKVKKTAYEVLAAYDAAQRGERAS